MRKNWITLWMCVFCFLFMFGTTTYGQELKYSSQNTWTSGEITESNTFDTYTVVLPSDGWLTVTLQGGTICTANIFIKDVDETETLWSKGIESSSPENPKTVTGTVALKAGIYKVNITRSKTYSSGLKYTYGTYRTRYVFVSANNNESEPNDSFETATFLKNNCSVTGFLPLYDKDFYKFRVDTRQNVKVTCTAMLYTWMGIWNEDRIKIGEVEGQYGTSETNPKTLVYEAVLEPGTYYIRPSSGTNFNASYGRYIIKWETAECDTHEWTSKVKTKATFSKDGTILDTCSVCGKQNKRTIYRLSSAELSVKAYTYNGRTKTPSVIVKNSVGTKLGNTYYSVSYVGGRKNVGTYKVIITFKGYFSGTVTKTFTINPAGTVISKLSSKSKGFSVTVKKNIVQTTGYQIQYATNSKFSRAVTKTISSNKKVSATYKSLKAKKKYYVRVRTYKTVSGKKYYSSWSKTVTVVTK